VPLNRKLLGVLVALVLCEVGARVWVRTAWPPERIAQLTTHASLRGRFASHPMLPYVLSPEFTEQNTFGFRGPRIEMAKAAGTRRIAFLGASTTYGIFVDADEAYPALVGAMLDKTQGAWEVINAGVPGWLSTESLIDFQLRVLPFDPDVVVILQGRNEILPQAYDGFQRDYTHFRRPGFNYSVSNYMHKEVFRWSHLAMLACTLRGERFGWSETEEHPLYGGIVWENRPDPAQAMRNLDDPARMDTLRCCLENMIELSRARGMTVLVCTMAFRPDKLALDELDQDPRLDERLGVQVERNNELAREVAGRLGATVVEMAQLSAREDLFVDDCHMRPEGHRLEAQMIYDALAPLLERP
jgi:lysophospholipase L1-like esterase